MPYREGNQLFVSIDEPIGSSLGDEWYNPSTNKLYKRVVINNTLGWTEISLTVNSITTVSNTQSIGLSLSLGSGSFLF